MANGGGNEPMSLTSLMCSLDQENDPICFTELGCSPGAEERGHSTICCIYKQSLRSADFEDNPWAIHFSITKSVPHYRLITNQ